MEFFQLNLLLFIVLVATDTPPLKQSSRRRNPARYPSMQFDNQSNKGSSLFRSNPLLQEGSCKFESANSWCIKKLNMFIALRHSWMCDQKVSQFT